MQPQLAPVSYFMRISCPYMVSLKCVHMLPCTYVLATSKGQKIFKWIAISPKIIMGRESFNTFFWWYQTPSYIKTVVVGCFSVCIIVFTTIYIWAVIWCHLYFSYCIGSFISICRFATSLSLHICLNLLRWNCVRWIICFGIIPFFVSIRGVVVDGICGCKMELY